MALIFCDSFDHYTTVASIYLKWPFAAFGGTPQILTGGRNGTNYIWMGGVNGWYPGRISRGLPDKDTYIVGFGYNIAVNYATQVIVGFIDTASYQVELRLNAAGRLYVTRNTVAIGSPGPTTVSFSQWHYIEMKVFISDTVGTVTVKLDGVDEIVLTNQDTKATANATINAISFNNEPASGSGYSVGYDDIYICDTTGSAPTNNFLGDIRVQALLPSGNGNSSAFVGSDGNSTDNYLLVDDPSYDGDTTYVESPTVGGKDTYVYGDLVPATGTVYGLQMTPIVRKTDAGYRGVVSVARLAGVESDSAEKPLTGSYAAVMTISEAKPGGGVWTIADVNAAEFGLKVTT